MPGLCYLCKWILVLWGLPSTCEDDETVEVDMVAVVTTKPSLLPPPSSLLYSRASNVPSTEAPQTLAGGQAAASAVHGDGGNRWRHSGLANACSTRSSHGWSAPSPSRTPASQGLHLRLRARLGAAGGCISARRALLLLAGHLGWHRFCRLRCASLHKGMAWTSSPMMDLIQAELDRHPPWRVQLIRALILKGLKCKMVIVLIIQHSIRIGGSKNRCMYN
jgi:hypothetical protein